MRSVTVLRVGGVQVPVCHWQLCVQEHALADDRKCTERQQKVTKDSEGGRVEPTPGEGFNRVCSSMHQLQQAPVQRSYTHTHTQTQGHPAKDMSFSHVSQEVQLKNRTEVNLRGQPRYLTKQSAYHVSSPSLCPHQTCLEFGRDRK